MGEILSMGNIITVIGGIISITVAYGKIMARIDATIEIIKAQQKEIDRLICDQERQETVNSEVYKIGAKIDILLQRSVIHN